MVSARHEQPSKNAHEHEHRRIKVEPSNDPNQDAQAECLRHRRSGSNSPRKMRSHRLMRLRSPSSGNISAQSIVQMLCACNKGHSKRQVK